MPVVGLGTFDSDRYNGEVITQTVKDAISVGYHHIDYVAGSKPADIYMTRAMDRISI